MNGSNPFRGGEMKLWVRRSLLLIFFCLWIETIWAQDRFYLKDGDRVVFYGDSITEQRLYTTFTETYVLTRFPQLKVGFVHSGVGGDRVTGGWAGDIDLRLNRDVFAYKPTVMTIMLGMNDGGYRALDEGLFNTYKKGYQHILESVKSRFPTIRLTLIQPSPYDDVTRPPEFEGGYNSVLVHYGRFVKELAEREKQKIADLNTSVVAALEKAKESDAALAKNVIEDRVHPGTAGQLLMAAALLKAWNGPSVVTAVEIDAAQKKVGQQKNTEVTGLLGSENFEWSQRDKALPMPLDLKDEVMRLAIRSSDFVETLDRQTLKVTGLKAFQYQLEIDGMNLGRFTKDQLAAGINLAELPTPMLKQALEVHELTLKHNSIHGARTQELQVGLAKMSVPHLQAALDALEGLERELVAHQRAAAQPRIRHYKLAAQ
jgi:lysophospholipase L1-like esterase